MTLHSHKVDGRNLVKDGNRPLEVPAGWEVAPCDANSARVCGAHAWQSQWLVFANGDVFGTDMCHLPAYKGNWDACGC